MPRNILTQQIAIKLSMVAAISSLPRLQNAAAEMIAAVHYAARPESNIDNETAFECSVALEQFAAALEMTAKELRAENNQLTIASKSESKIAL